MTNGYQLEKLPVINFCVNKMVNNYVSNIFYRVRVRIDVKKCKKLNFWGYEKFMILKWVRAMQI